VQGICYALDPSLVKMMKLSWNAVDSVGDQSDYISQIARTMDLLVSSLKRTLIGNKFWKTFCDKLVDAFLISFQENISKCGVIGEVGAEQMLLDTHALRSILVQMPAIGGGDKKESSSLVYSKLLAKVNPTLMIGNLTY
jgi:hypothetical protein